VQALRLFCALWPAPEEQQALMGATAAAVARSPGRPIPVANLHVTLAFLGNVEAVLLPQLRAVLQSVAVAAAGGPLHLQFESLEHWMRPQILCATASAAGDAANHAFALAASLRRSTLASGFTPDLKPFHAHVTVARKVQAAPQAQPIARVTWNLGTFALVASSTSASGSVYSVLESYPLDRPGNARK
jgi:2'-5' RNA ligase